MHKRKIVLNSLLFFVLVSPIVLVLPIFLNSPTVSPIEPNNLQSNYFVTYADNLTSLSNTVWSSNPVTIDQQADITGVTLENFELTNSHNFFAFQSNPYILSFTMDNVILSGDLQINGSPTISADSVAITNNFDSYFFDVGYRIASPILTLNNFNATLIRLRMNGGTFSWSNSKATTLTLDGFQSALVQSSDVTGAITIVGTNNITISGTTYGSIVETVDPVLAVEQTSFSIPYNFVFQPSAKLTLRWAAYDNVQGPNFALQTNLTIYKNGQYQETISDVSANSQEVTIQTSAALYEIYVSCKDKQGNMTTTKITIVTTPNLLWFILMIAIIAGAAVGTVLLFYWRKQHQWQKTSLVEIPA